MTELNGFKIAKYNVHSLPENTKYHTCPLCSHTRKKKTQKCLTIRWEVGLAKCSHCGELIQLHEYEKKSKPVDWKIPEWQNNTDLSENVVKWFEGRKISQFILRLMKISEGKESMPDNEAESGWAKKNTIQFPYYRYGEIINVKYRSGDKAFKLYKGAEKIAYNLDNAIGHEEIYLTEGEIDVLSIMQIGIHNVISPPNGFTEKGNVNLDWLNNDVDIFLNAEKLILVFDNDIPGENGKREFIRRFGAHKCYQVDLRDCKDPNEFLFKYGSDELKNALENYQEIPLENVSTYETYKETVREFFINGMPKGIVTDTMPNLDLIFSTNLGHTILVTGIPSSGKSEVVDQMVISYALKYGHKTGYASPENKPNELHLQKILRKLNGITPKTRADFNASFQACEKFADDHFYFIDLEKGYDLERVLMKAEELVYRRGIKVLVIDPFNKVKYKGKVESLTGNRTNDYTNAYLEKLDAFGAQYGVLVILVAHPIKMNRKEDGKRAVPDFYDVKGGGEFYDMFYHGLVAHRDYDKDITLIRTLKVKFLHLGENNKDAWFKYNINNGRYAPIEGDVDSNNYTPVWDNSNWVTSRNTEKQQSFNDNSDFWSQVNETDEQSPF